MFFLFYSVSVIHHLFFILFQTTIANPGFLYILFPNPMTFFLYPCLMCTSLLVRHLSLFYNFCFFYSSTVLTILNIHYSSLPMMFIAIPCTSGSVNPFSTLLLLSPSTSTQCYPVPSQGDFFFYLYHFRVSVPVYLIFIPTLSFFYVPSFFSLCSPFVSYLYTHFLASNIHPSQWKAEQAMPQGGSRAPLR